LAGLIHNYHFSPEAPLADDAGGAHLEAEGEVAISPEGFASFDGRGILLADLMGASGENYAISFWFRRDDLLEQEGSAAIIASTSDNPFAGGNWAVEFRGDSVRFGGKPVEGGGVIQPILSKPEAGMWHLITLKFTTNEGSGVWVNGEPFLAFSPFRSDEPEAHVSFSGIRQLVIGGGIQRNAGFCGDIADIRIHDDLAWGDEKQAALYAEGPSLGVSGASSTPE
jgi:hypothetical protein